ncbi:MAG: hypothetical protein HQL77_03195 [Magnetococcales bacterium]|nr:hypothetical protein [Magnetococcales bacterium]
MAVDYAHWLEYEMIPVRDAILLSLGGDPSSEGAKINNRHIILDVLGMIAHAQLDHFAPVHGEDGHPVVDDDGQFQRGERLPSSEWRDVRQDVIHGDRYVTLGSFLEWTARCDSFMDMALRMGMTYPPLLLVFLREKGHDFSDVFRWARDKLERRKRIVALGDELESLVPGTWEYQKNIKLLDELFHAEKKDRAKETARHRKIRLTHWYQEERDKNPKGAMQRVAHREGVSRQRIASILSHG